MVFRTATRAQHTHTQFIQRVNTVCDCDTLHRERVRAHTALQQQQQKVTQNADTHNVFTACTSIC